MKKSKLLLLLAPSLFLFTSCDTAPKIDTISEADAINYIQNQYKDYTIGDTFNTPKKGIASWTINEEEPATESKNLIKQYTGIDNPELKYEKYEISDTRINNYVSELNNSSVTFTMGTDVVVGMNEDIFNKLYSIKNNGAVAYDFVYKYAGSGLMINIVPSNTKEQYTRTHYYDGNGRETKFEMSISKDGKNFSLSIEFNY